MFDEAMNREYEVYSKTSRMPVRFTTVRNKSTQLQSQAETKPTQPSRKTAETELNRIFVYDCGTAMSCTSDVLCLYTNGVHELRVSNTEHQENFLKMFIAPRTAFLWY